VTTPSPNAAAPSDARGVGAAQRRLALVMATAGALAIGAGQGPAPAPDNAAASADQTAAPPEARLLDASLDEAARAEAAQAIVRNTRFEEAAGALEATPDPIGARLLIDAIAEAGLVSDGPLRALGAAAKAAPEDASRRALEILAGSRSRTAVRGALEVYRSDRPADLREAARRALVRQTGMSQLGDDPEAWSAWWAEVEWLTEPEWRARLAAAHSARAQRLEQQRDALADRLTDTFRRLHAALPQDQRSTLIAELITDERVELRLLGLDLAERAMLNARPLTDAALAAAISRMMDADERVRTRASLIVARAAPPNAGEAAADALRTETSPVAASAQLSIVARFPRKSAAQPALRWLDDDALAGGAAAEALSAMARAGMLDDPARRTRAIERLGEIDPQAWAVGHVRLIDALGDDADIDRLAAHGLDAPTLEVREAAAEAIARRPGREDAIVRALRREPALLGAISRGVGARLASRAGLDALRRMASRAQATEALAPHENALIGMMPPREALAVIADLPDAPRRLALLEGLCARADPPDAALAALARERLAAGDGVGAVEAADRLRDPSGEQARRTLVLVLAWTNDMERAAELDAPKDAWLEAFELMERAGVAHAGSVASMILSLHAETLSESERSRLERAAPADASAEAGSPTKSSGGSDGDASPPKSGF